MADTDTAELERPETAQAAAVPTPNSSIGDLIKMPEGLRNDLMVNRADLAKANKATIDQTDRRDDEDRARAIKAYNASGIGPDDLPKWDVERERQKYSTNPIESFGSFASVFAIAAAAFTKAPMENALNGASAAMNAIRAGNEQEYEHAFGAWKENNAIAIKRAEIMHRQYQDAMDMRKVDMTRGDVKLRQLALQFGDQQAMTFLEHGMDPQFFELISTRAAAAKGIMEADHGITLDGLQKQALTTDREFLEGNPTQKYEAAKRIFGVKEDTVTRVINRAIAEDPKISAEELSDLISNTRSRGKRMSSAGIQSDMEFSAQARLAMAQGSLEADEEYQAGTIEQKANRAAQIFKAKETWQKSILRQVLEENPAATSADMAEAISKATRSADRGNPITNFRAQIMQKAVEEATAKNGRPPNAAEMANIQAMAFKKGMTAYQEQRIDDARGKVESVINNIDYAIELMKKAEAEGTNLVGLRGKAGLIEEFVLGSRNERFPEHAAFEQTITRIGQMAMPILKGTTRLNKEDQRTRDITVPGLGIFRNKDQVLQGLQDLKRTLQKRDLLEQLEEPMDPRVQNLKPEQIEQELQRRQRQ